MPETGYNTLAILVFVLAFVTSIGVLSITCAQLALGEIRRAGKRGHGLAGPVLGYLEFASLVFVVAGLLVLR